jgi:FSR family fosmidomycin resistance protein-like MFS transporter
VSVSQTTVHRPTADNAAFAVVITLSACHFLNDMMQSMLAAIYPMLKTNYGLDFGQIGLLTLTFQVTASLLQPVIGAYADKRPLTYSLPVGMGCTFVGLIMLALAGHYWLLLLGASAVGLGSAVFHPESSRVARLASGGRHGTAQSIFQVGGNLGSAVGPLLAAFIILPMGQTSVAWFSVAALLGIVALTKVGNWYSRYRVRAAKEPAPITASPYSRRRIIATLVVLALLVFSKYIYLASLTSYYIFYLMHKFAIPVQDAQVYLFLFLGAVAVGTLIGGPIGDRIGRKQVIWCSILGVLPFTLALPYADLFWTAILSMIIGVVLASAFPAIVVFAQELVPGRVGMVAGLFFGFAFGMGGISAAVLGQIADVKGIDYVYTVCSFLPLIGLLTIFLPNTRKAEKAAA